MRFVETTSFTRDIARLLPDEEYQWLQSFLAERPSAGALLRKTGGLRKLRWANPHRGKRGGLRLIYYWDPLEEVVYMLLVYGKSERNDLKQSELADLAASVRELLH